VETTIDENEHNFYSIPQKHPPHVNNYHTTHEEIIDEQCVYATTGNETTAQQQEDDDDWIEMELAYPIARLTEGCEKITDDQILVFATNKKSGKTKKMIQKSLDILTSQEIKDNWQQVQEASRKEVQSFKDHGTYEVKRAVDCPNICSAKWVFKWKTIDGQRAIKARLTVRGFEDLARDMQCFSATASRWSQKVILSVAVQRGWELMVADVATAFLQGMTFRELADLQGTPIREVAFRPPKGSEHFFQALEGKLYQPDRDVLAMLKPVYGLKDAPAAWRAKLALVLKGLGGKPCHIDSCLWIWHDGGLLTAIISTHVDDLKGAGVKEVIRRIVDTLEKAFGKCKTAYRVFEHCGILHEQSDDLKTVRIHQNHYVQQLQPLDLAGMRDNVELNDSQHADYLSLLGGLSWTVQTRMDIAVFICALQRAAKTPLGEHAGRCNKVLKWARKHPYFLTYKKMRGEATVLTISDSAFRKEDARGLAMRGSITGLAPFQEETPGSILHVILFWASKQRRVTRSTFSSELNSLVDSIDFAKQLAMLMAEILIPQTSARAIAELEESGRLPLSIVGVIDAQSVYDALKAQELRTPSEASLMLMMCGVKELLRSGTLRRLFWVDTTDMVADGLGKGTVSRKALMELGEYGEWLLQFAPKGFTETKFTPISEQ
jgi:Reverse transcriptase (RNA-dependent DNA polymerase)